MWGEIVSRTEAGYVPVLGDHWLCTEYSTVRKHLPTFHGTETEATRRLYTRVHFLTGRGWRVRKQTRNADTMPGKRRMLVRIEPPAEYAHCGASVVEYRSCGGPAWCKLCAAVERSEAWDHPVQHAPETAAVRHTAGQYGGTWGDVDLDDTERAQCRDPRFEMGVCASCGQSLRMHLPKLAREAGSRVRTVHHVSTSRQLGTE